IVAFMAVCLGCVKETQSRAVVPTENKWQKPVTTHHRTHSGAAIIAVMLDPAPYLPSVYSEEGLRAIQRALISKGKRLVQAECWDDLFETTRGVRRHRADLAVIVSFRDVPDLATSSPEVKQECACKLSARIVEVGSSKLVDSRDLEQRGAPDTGFDKACLNSVLVAAQRYADIAAGLIADYDAQPEENAGAKN
ncbi:MAG: hypothetical protein JW941_07825, partial [Candidatus Coatesbacteria bacterium]|nr:hypothetical protein [Candidatus Coatesbacteria bacterium]